MNLNSELLNVQGFRAEYSRATAQRGIMSKEHEMKIQCSMHLNDMIQKMKNKVGYDEDDIIFLIQKWVKASMTFPHQGQFQMNQAKKYWPFFRRFLLAGKVTASSEVAPNPPDEPESNDKSSKYLYRRLLDLANTIYVDAGWRYLAYNQTEGAVLRLVYNYRVMLARSDADLAKKFQARLVKLHM